VTSTSRDPVLEKRYRWQHAVLLLVGSRSSDSVARFDTTDVQVSTNVHYETQQNSASELESTRTYSVHTMLKTQKANKQTKRTCEKQKKKVDTTPRCSRVVPHPSTKRAQHILSSEFGRDRLYYV
jgi:hypothetical protein